MKAVLDYWNRRWQSVVFDPVHGKARIRWFGGGSRRCAGWAAYYNRRWYAVRLDDDVLVFQVGADRWSMESGLHCLNTQDGESRVFSIFRSEELVFSCKYASDPALDEPTADELDREMTDFFYWTTRVWNNLALRESLKSAWR